MAVMNPHPLLSAMPAPPQFGDLAQTKRQEPFDAALLCSKLEAYRRDRLERGAARERRRGECEPARIGVYYIPQNAAKQFAATATPMKEDTGKDRKRSKPTRTTAAHAPSTMASSVTDGRARVNPKMMYAAMSVGMSESEMLANAAASEPGRRGARDVLSHPIHHARDVANSQSTKGHPIRRQPSPKVRNAIPMQSYMPGDAASRRPIVEPATALISAGAVGVARPLNPVDVPAHRRIRDQENEMPYDLDFAEHDDLPVHPARPRLDHHDRNDWAQVSQCDDEMRRHTLNMSLLHRKTKLEAPQEDRRPSAQSDHLLSDAVKLVKKAERARKRESIMGFFKKF